MSSSESSTSQQITVSRAQNLNGSTLLDVHFTDADFQQVQANQSALHNCQFDQTPFHAVVIRNATWQDNQFVKCVGRFMEVESSDFHQSRFDQCQFEESSFYEVSFANSQWTDCSLIGGDFRYSSFKDATLRNVNLNNCDLAQVDFTGCTLENVSVYNARITNAVGLTEEMRDQLLAGGAYEGLPPAFNKLRKRSLNLQREFTERARKLTQSIRPKTWLDTQQLQNRIQSTFQEWKAERQRQQEALQQQEEAWKAEQEKRRQKAIEERKIREEKRKQEKEAQRTERERLQERRKQEQEIQQLLQSQKTERQDLQKEIQRFFEDLEKEGHLPESLEELSIESTRLYQDTEESLAQESILRQALTKNPLNEGLQQQLAEQSQQTQRLAQEAMDSQQRYFQALQEWKRKEAQLLESLQQQAIQRSTQLLLQNIDSLSEDPHDLNDITEQGRRNLLKAQLEYERSLIAVELEALDQELESDIVDGKAEIEHHDEESFETDLIDIEQIPTDDTVLSEIESPEEQAVSEEYTSIFSRVNQWLFGLNTVNTDENKSSQNTEHEDTEDSLLAVEDVSEIEADTESSSLQSTDDVSTNDQQDHFPQALQEQLALEMDALEQGLPTDVKVDPATLASLRRIQERLVKNVLQDEVDTNTLSPTELHRLQSQLITESLLSFKAQVEREQQVERARLEKIEQQRQENEEQQRLREAKEQARKEELKQIELARQQREIERAQALEKAHKDQLKRIIDRRYQTFEQQKQKPTVEEVNESFVESFEFEESSTQIQNIQQRSIETSLHAWKEAKQEQQRLVLEQQRLAEEKEKREQARLQAEQKQQEERERQEQHRAELERKAKETREKALAEAKRRKEEQRLAKLSAKERREKERQQQQRLLEEQRQKEQQAKQEAKEKARQAKLTDRKRKEEAKAKEVQRREQERELRRLEALEQEQLGTIARKKERLSNLKNQLLQEAQRQEYQELSQQIEADIEVQQSQALERQRKQEAFLQQTRAEQERRAKDPLLLEQERQQELFVRKQKRLERLQEREREIQTALDELRLEYEQSDLNIPTEDLSVQFQSPLQQRWYRFTDAISTQSPSLAKALDNAKEQVEELYISRQAQARFEREQQKKVAANALEEKRKLEHQNRLKRLAEIRAKEEQREAKLLDEAEQRAYKEAEYTRQRERLALSAEARHALHRVEATHHKVPVLLSEQDLRGENHIAARWIECDAKRATLSGIRLEAANLVGTDFSLGLLDYAVLKGATLDRARLDKSNLEGVSLQQASLRQAHLRLTRMYDADLRQVDAESAFFEAVDCSGSRANGANFSKGTLRNCTLVEMSLQNSNFQSANLEGSVFNRSDLSGAIFDNALVTNTDFRGARGLSTEQLTELQSRGALVELTDAIDRYGTWGAPQLRVAVVLFLLGVGSIVITQTLDAQHADLESLEAEAQALRDEDVGLASERYEQLALSSQILDEQVQYYIEAAILAEQNSDLERSEMLFNQAIAAADLNTELNTKVGLRFAEFLLTHSKPAEALARLQTLMTYQSLSTFQRAKLIFYTEQSCQILNKDADQELKTFYASMDSLPEVQADLHMALSDLRLQHGQSAKALAELQTAETLVVSDGLALRLIESKARAHDRLGNISEAIDAYEALRTKAEPNGQTAQTATLALADLWRREGNVEQAMSLLDTLTESASNDGRLRSRSLLIQGRLLEEQDRITEAAEKYKEVLNIQTVEPETLEESRVSLARLLLQNDPQSVGDLPPEILSQAKLGEARTILDQGNFEDAIEMYSSIIQTDDLKDDIRRAAQSGMAEALSNLGKHQEANDIWEGLLREKIDAVESQHIEVLLAYSKLQANDIEGARLAFASLQQSNDALIRYQGLMGDAQASVLAGELERAKDSYERILQTQPSEDIQIQVWQELAQIAQEQNAIEDVLLAWQNILQFGVDDEALRAEAHTSIARALAQMDRLDEAISECELNLSTPEAQLQCAMILEMAEDSRAVERYRTLVENERIGDVLRSEAALGAARLTDATTRAKLCEMGLGLSQIDPIVELQLIQLYLETPDLPTETQEQWSTRQQALATTSPQILVQYLMERTSQLRAEGDVAEASRTMKQGITGLPEEYGNPLRLELADMLLEQQRLEEAIQEYSLLLNTDTNPQLVRAGLARAYMQQAQWANAREALQEIPTELVTGTEIHMIMEINQAAPTAEGLELANAWATQASNPDVQWEALMTQAHTALGDDNTEQAMSLFQEAKSVAVEPRQQQWSLLGQAQVFSAMGNYDEATTILENIQDSQDSEVQAQYHIQRTQSLLADDKLDEALATIENYSANDLGPGWDMTIIELHVQVLSTLQRFEEAHQILTAIQERWPNEEQVQIPSSIAQVQLLQQESNMLDAQALAENSREKATDPVYQAQLDELLTSLQ